MIALCVFLLYPAIFALCHAVNNEDGIENEELPTLNTFFVNRNYTVDILSEMDMMMSVNQYKSLYGPSKSKRGKRKAYADDVYYWQLGYVIYEIYGNIILSTDVIKEAINHWEKYTCLQFIEADLMYYGIQFRRGDSCSSYVGNIWDVQEILLSKECINVMAIVHQIGHSIGFIHEHSRPDRDSYIKINFEGAPPAAKVWYKKYTTGINTFGIPYDYSSIMHYNGFGLITTLDPAYQTVIGNRIGLSFKDIKLANVMYDCDRIRGNCSKKECPFNGFVFYKKFKGMPKCECFCDSGNVSDPLVPCSSITHEVPGPNIVAASSMENIDTNRCLDVLSNCEELKSKGLCLTEITKMSIHCPKTCETCGKGENFCMDYSTGCELMAASCKEPQIEDLMNNMCRKTCKICTDPASLCDIELALSSPMSNKASVEFNQRIKAAVALQILVISLIY